MAKGKSKGVWKLSGKGASQSELSKTFGLSGKLHTPAKATPKVHIVIPVRQLLGLKRGFIPFPSAYVLGVIRALREESDAIAMQFSGKFRADQENSQSLNFLY